MYLSKNCPLNMQAFTVQFRIGLRSQERASKAASHDCFCSSPSRDTRPDQATCSKGDIRRHSRTSSDVGWSQTMTPENINRCGSFLLLNVCAMRDLVQIVLHLLGTNTLIREGDEISQLDNPPGPCRLEICQKIYTTKFSVKRILHTENA